jgi:hypothetical protein
MTAKTHKDFKVAVYFRDEDGIWHHHGTWEGQAHDAADAKHLALDALEDTRIEWWKAEILSSGKPKGGP